MCLYSVHPFLTVNWPWKEENIGEIRYVFHFGANLHSRQTFQGFFRHFRLYDKHFSYFHGVTGKAGISSPTWILWPAEWLG